MVKGAYTKDWMSSYWYEYYGTRFTKQRIQAPLSKRKAFLAILWLVQRINSKMCFQDL